MTVCNEQSLLHEVERAEERAQFHSVWMYRHHIAQGYSEYVFTDYPMQGKWYEFLARFDPYGYSKTSEAGKELLRQVKANDQPDTK